MIDATLREGLAQQVLYLESLLSDYTELAKRTGGEFNIEVCVNCYSPDECACGDVRWPIDQAIQRLKLEIA